MTEPHEPPENAVHRLTRDPVRIVWVSYGLIQGSVIALTTAEIVSHRASTVVTGVALAVYVAVSELFVRAETVPRSELTPDELAHHPKP